MGKGNKRARQVESDPGRIVVEIGNTYKRLREEEAPISRDGRSKIHQWKLWARVLRGGEVDSLQRVVFRLHPTFQPQEYTKTLPPFTTKQTSYGGGFIAEVKLTLDDGVMRKVDYLLKLEEGGGKQTAVFQRNTAPMLRNVKPMALPPRTFGVELELTVPKDITLNKIQEDMTQRGIRCQVHSSANHTVSPDWKIVPDSSVSCNRGQDCNTFELVSPKLEGGEGLQQVHKVLQLVEKLQPQVNSTAGLHVHVNVEDLNLMQKKKVCMNFIKYEDAFDLIVPVSRRGNSNEHCKSNRSTFQGSNQDANLKIAACASEEQLYELLNPAGDRYHKLNLQPIARGRQPTFEFRQHSASFEYPKVANWVRLVIMFVDNSAKFQSPSAFLSSRSAEEKLPRMFEWVIKDRVLRDFYKERAEQLKEPCCGGCASDGACAANTCRSCPK
mmetsp:Transcript_26077/g.31659  ORF Transcript_26077/g.31659 Transcript_26077/m.31659 type:complete len:441 (-) Transcript_26077:1139-2461(-)|eukprot:CAMPEP_0197853540 /NCGR_PEP_ID=MMETSP1438-20131217/22942_1 /TAXON_ID=1461541 /ORGANISM="Pterosperma sp., Strain CCMP1384" /LENGTH=440 /DNA_ID=CAMNT_0043467993 /DNA_START=192 /DNA_END=1514 /DNA_ORIENTATION=-